VLVININFTIVPIVPQLYLALRYKFERISVGIAIQLQLYQLYLTILEKKKQKIFIKIVYTRYKWN